ncbi:hypothetical protein RchiOBHm_Chr1g0329171 [Rosa chinensis]|uniref:Uncharacterized protein n=1 Tax=Rosa chinensis TaxID=74649 RepID=A0A2P6SB18_ROSCH|nr:hypothetical protein RchiOBHm_Chr1g0329171 [Rosa chinensis]
MQGTSLTLTKVAPKLVMSLPWEALRYLGGLQNRPLLLLPQIMQRLLLYMKLYVNVYG